MAAVFPLFLYFLCEGARSLGAQGRDDYSRWLARQSLPRMLWELERTGRRRENVPTFGFLLRATLRWVAPRFHPVTEGNTQQALDYLARSPAARAAALREGEWAA